MTQPENKPDNAGAANGPAAAADTKPANNPVSATESDARSDAGVKLGRIDTQSTAAPEPIIGTEASASPASRWSVRKPVVFGWALIVGLFGGVMVWATQTELAGAVVAPGQVEVEQQRQVVQHLDGGVVDEILVKDGTSVAAGEPLIRLDGTMLNIEYTIVEGQYFEVLARRGRLEAERADAGQIEFPEELLAAAENSKKLNDLVEGQRSLFFTRLDTVKQSLDQLQKQSEQVTSQIDGIDAQLAALKTQRELIGEELVDQESLLERGLAQASRVLSLKREAARIDGEIGELKASRASSETRQTELDIQSLRLTAQRREEAETELRDLGYRELELAERRRSLIEQTSRLEILAPVSGIVYNMTVTTPRSVIRPAEPLLYIIPQDRPLVISARLATINIDDVRIGQPAVLRFPSFSSRTTPQIDGQLSKVSADVLTDNQTGAVYYRVETSIPPDELAKLGEDIALVPGMPVEVYIQTGQRTPLAYLMKPLTDYFQKAFRD